MRAFQTVYLVILAAAAAMALLMSLNDAAILALMLTLGLAFPLVFAATFVPYMVAFLPLVFSARRRLVVALPVSIALAVAWFAVPSILSERQVNATVAALIASDVRPTEPTVGRTFELRRKKSFLYGLGGQFMPEEPCSDFCRSLLLGGEVDWVRIVMVDDRPASRKKAEEAEAPSTFFRALKGQKCAAPGEPAKADERCVVFADDSGEPASMIAEISEKSRIDRLKLGAGALFSPGGERVVTISRMKNGQPEVVLQNTELQLHAVMKGSLLGPEISGMNSRGIAFVKSPREFNHADFPTLLRAVGYTVADFSETPAPDGAKPKRSWQNPPSADDSRAVVSVLDLPAATFNQEQGAVIDRWMMHARAYSEWPAERLELLRRIVRDHRVTMVSFFDQVFERNPTVTKALMPDVLDRIATMGEERNLDPGWGGAIAMRRIDPALLTPYADRILTIARSGGRAGDAILGAVGRVGVDPKPYLEPMRKPADGEIDGERVQAACRAEARWAPSLVPMLRGLVTEAELSRSSARIEYVLEALMRHGDKDFVLQAIESSKWSDADRQRRRLMSRWDRDGATERFC
jgi:hypothetical protein